MGIIIYMVGFMLSIITGFKVFRTINEEKLTMREIMGICVFSITSYVGIAFFGMFYLLFGLEKR